MARREGGGVTPEAILADHPEAVRDLAGRLRRLVREVVPSAAERAYPGWHAIGYREPSAGYFCGIFPFDHEVRLLFEHGAALDDPDGLLEGERLKQVRYVALRPEEPVPEAALRALVLRALHHGALRGRARR